MSPEPQGALQSTNFLKSPSHLGKGSARLLKKNLTMAGMTSVTVFLMDLNKQKNQKKIQIIFSIDLHRYFDKR